MSSDVTQPIYVSKPSGRSMGQTYRVYPDCVELPCRILFKTFVIPVDEIVDVKVVPPHQWLRPIVDFFCGRWGMSLDWNIFFRHVRIERRGRLIRYVDLIPDDPDQFAAAVTAILRHRDPTGKHGWKG